MSELETAVSIVLDDAQPQLEPVRAEFPAGSVAMGIPLHLTLLYPFAPPDQVDEEALERFFAKCDAPTITLFGLGEWPRVVYAVPEPRDQLLAMMRLLWDAMSATWHCWRSTSPTAGASAGDSRSVRKVAVMGGTGSGKSTVSR